MMERDMVITLPSGTEIDVMSAVGDLGRIRDALLEAGVEDLAADVGHVAELVEYLAGPAPAFDVLAAMRRIVEYDLPTEEADYEQQLAGGDGDGHIYHDLVTVRDWLLQGAIDAGEAETGDVSVSDPAFVAKAEPLGVKVTIDRSEQDGVPVVFVDTDEDVIPHDDEFHGPRLRIRLNDHLLHGLMLVDEDDARLLRKFGPDTGN